MELVVMLVEPLSEMVAAFNTAPFRSHVVFDFASALKVLSETAGTT
jgi:hypothetical protein